MAVSGAFSTSNEKIKYTIEVVQNSQSVGSNTSNVTVKVRFYRTNTGYETYGSGTVYCKINGTTYSAGVTSSQKITNSGIVLFTKTLNIEHGADGTKTLTCSAWIDHSRVTSSEQSYSQTLTTIPRSAILSDAPNFTNEDNPTITYSNPAGSAVTSLQACISFTGENADVPYRDIPIDGTSYQFELTDAERSTLMSSIPNAVSRTVKFFVRTVIGDVSYHSTLTRTFTITDNITPSISVEISEGGNAYGLGWIQDITPMEVNITPTLAYGSPIVSYKTAIDGKTYTGANVTTDVLKTAGELTLSVTAEDARGRKATYTESINVHEYSPPQITNLKVERCNADGTANKSGGYAKISYTAKMTLIDGVNYMWIDSRYKKTSESEYGYGEAAELYDSSLTIYLSPFEVETGASYDVRIEATDDFGKLATATARLGSVSKFLSMYKNIGLAIGKVFDISRPNSVQIGFDIYDKYDTQMRNGVVAYTGSGTDTAIDPNTTLEHCFLTIINTPTTNQFWYIVQYFYNGKSETGNRMQVAYPYKINAVSYHRYYINGAWSEWQSDGLAAYPVNSLYISYSHTSPAELFGGTWTRVIHETGAGTFLYGCTEAGVIGECGGVAAHTHGALNSANGTLEAMIGSGYTDSASLAFRASNYNNRIVSTYHINGTVSIPSNVNSHNTIVHGETASASNIPPYIKVSIWRRTA